ncbi:quinone-dependent dihydroorotate dehydrogenase [Psychrosphaera sp. B3R10]|uniref:quinone-dependent dihydroorotate dehydrogenase n=1 Tax=unclassified Psychrosphaera TaxID=2641570 RepID=UPI001C084AB0|nr:MULTISPECIES: quinone-dependent dihydroorotate dehydrogenase [unclassified Psychrosphaera]MBU2881290.1 quinone-dependent dihydroorotate dehydrogenase [Psychrosphaera sp. I2R16]MBU2988389.1 quinone-dependent dihydroorotate dehydrogenase [Psychrosphaera sp. B3R10]MDO6720111.1 quinone-dependent dihydroorotate dehydrogenase [Psychrosphaera sp. 1_MG-2023]
MFYQLAKRFMFSRDAEWAHEFALKNLKRFANTPASLVWKQNLPEKPVKLLGLTFPNPVGLAAGLDKNGECIDALGQMGFGFIEIGTVTPVGQPGNPKPRMFRITEKNAIINRMGFNNHGVDNLIKNVRNKKYKGILGINIGKNKDTPNEKGHEDYVACLEKVYPYADYITVNISSPNTPGLRDLQFGDSLEVLLAAVKNRQLELQAEHHKYVPILVKIAPDMDKIAVEQVVDCIVTQGMDGIIATNTTLSREAVAGLEHADEAGGLSGDPVRDVSTDVIKMIRAINRDIPIIGVGGINGLEAAKEKLDAGASLVQVYSNFIYQGPKLIKDIVTGL